MTLAARYEPAIRPSGVRQPHSLPSRNAGTAYRAEVAATLLAPPARWRRPRAPACTDAGQTSINVRIDDDLYQ